MFERIWGRWGSIARGRTRTAKFLHWLIPALPIVQFYPAMAHIGCRATEIKKGGRRAALSVS